MMKIYIIQDVSRYTISACFTTEKAIELCSHLAGSTYREIELFTDGYDVEALLAGPIPAELLKGW